VAAVNRGGIAAQPQIAAVFVSDRSAPGGAGTYARASNSGVSDVLAPSTTRTWAVAVGVTTQLSSAVMTDGTQAPGELEQISAFVNTVDLEAGRDELAQPEALAAWLADRGLAPAEVSVRNADLRRAIELREALRAVLLAHNDGQDVPAGAALTLEAAAQRARIRLRFLTDGQTQLEPAAGGVDAALGRLLAIVHGAIADGSWGRLKACREHSCAWAFYDHTRNHSRAWCDMQVCGNRAKARAYRRRHAQ